MFDLLLHHITTPGPKEGGGAPIDQDPHGCLVSGIGEYMSPNQLNIKIHSHRGLDWLVETKPWSGPELSGSELYTSVFNGFYFYE